MKLKGIILTLNLVVLLVPLAGCSSSKKPGNDSANSNGINRSEAILLSEVVTKTINLGESKQAKNIDRTYLVGKTSEDSPICEKYSQRVVGIDWVSDDPIAKFDVWHSPVTCPEKANEYL